MNDIEKRARELLARAYEADGMVGRAGVIRNPSQYMEKPDRRALGCIITALTPQWQPIESAPKDGTFYLATNGTQQRVENCPDGYAAGVWNLIDGEWRGSAFGFDSTHWHPLPARPEMP